MKTIATTCVLLALLVGPSAVAVAADGERGGVMDLTCALQPTQAGWDVNAKGVAKLWKTSRGEGLAVKVQAELKDKTMLIVSVIRDGRSYDIGLSPMLLGVAVFETQTFRDGFSKAFPIAGVSGIIVRLDDTILLKGTCGGQNVSPK